MVRRGGIRTLKEAKVRDLPQSPQKALCQGPASTNSATRAWNKNIVRPSTTEEKSSFAAPQRIAGRTTAWIKLTEPGGKLIHINVEHVTSVRSDTQIPGARAQLDLTSGKFQGVQENVEQVMQLISAAPGARENDETPSATL